MLIEEDVLKNPDAAFGIIPAAVFRLILDSRVNFGAACADEALSNLLESAGIDAYRPVADAGRKLAGEAEAAPLQTAVSWGDDYNEETALRTQYVTGAGERYPMQSRACCSTRGQSSFHRNPIYVFLHFQFRRTIMCSKPAARQKAVYVKQALGSAQKQPAISGLPFSPLSSLSKLEIHKVFLRFSAST